MDIAAAQVLFEMPTRLSRVEMRLAPGIDRDAFMSALNLPAGVYAETPGLSTQRNDRLTRAYRINLAVLALLALASGALLVFSTLSLAVARRRSEIALLRALGLTRRGVVWLVLIEAALIGALGALAGVALAGLLVMLPVAWQMNAMMASLLVALGALYVIANLAIARRTHGGQAIVEQHHGEVYGRVGDVIGNVTVVQSYGRFASEMQAMRAIMERLLAAQYPVLTWWGILTVLTRTAATITVVVLYAVGSVLVARDEISVGEIVAFVG